MHMEFEIEIPKLTQVVLGKSCHLQIPENEIPSIVLLNFGVDIQS